MFNLLNKVYLKSEHQYSKLRDCIVISETYGTASAIPQLRNTLNGQSVGEHLFQAPTYDKLIADHFGGDDHLFFTYLLEWDAGRRLTIYCDRVDMVMLLSKWYKTLCPQLDQPTFVKLMRLCCARMAYYFGLGDVGFSTLSDVQVQDIKAFDVNSSYLNSLWDVEAYSVTEEQRAVLVSAAPIEFQLITMVVSEQEQEIYSNRALVEQKIVQFVKKTMISEFILDTKDTYLRHLDHINDIDPSVTFDFDGTWAGSEQRPRTLEQFVQMYPAYKFLDDPKFVPDEFDYVWATYDMASLYQVRLKVITRYHGHYRLMEAMFRNDLSLQHILDYELGTSGKVFPVILGNESEYQEKLNTYLVWYILRQRRDGKLDDLRPMSLLERPAPTSAPEVPVTPSA